MLCNLDEITLIPARTSNIVSRSLCDSKYGVNHPIFISPMACLTNLDNVNVWKSNNVTPVVPRTVAWDDRMNLLSQGYWVAVGFREAMYLYREWREKIKSSKQLDFVPHLCIDQAQGHLKDLLELCANFKRLLGKDVILMTGNIANPSTYYDYAINGVDYVRVSVGTGHGCTTSCQTGFNYPMGSLLANINEVRKDVKRDLLSGVSHKDCIYTEPKVIADGGLHTNAQIIKALALGADYVMLGEIAGSSEEACGHDVYLGSDGKVYYDLLHYQTNARAQP